MGLGGEGRGTGKEREVWGRGGDIGVEGYIRGDGRQGQGMGGKGSGWEWNGVEGLLKLLLIFPKTCAEPGNPS